jgi:transcriptional regulator NrdR family protein
MQCVNDACDSTTTRIVETNTTQLAVYRRRCCEVCGAKYVTVEGMAKVQEVPRKKRKKDEPQTES